MFDLLIERSDVSAPLRARAAEYVAGVLVTQATLRMSDLQRRRQYLAAELSIPGRGRQQASQVDLDAVGAQMQALDRIRLGAAREAHTHLESLLRLLNGPVQALEFGEFRFAARLPSRESSQHSLRMLLLPEQPRRMRVQIQPMEGVDPRTLQRAMPRCYGELGSALMDWSLDRMDLSSLVLTALAYVAMN